MRCGFDDKRALQFDHIHGGGRSHTLPNVMTAYRDMVKDPSQYQVLCANCNWIKKHDLDENPYRKVDS